MSAEGKVTLLAVATFALLTLATFGLGSCTCHSGWENSGFPTQWGPMKGCQIQLKNGTWIPADAYREIK